MLKSQMKKLLVTTFALAFVACLGSVAFAEQAVLTAADCVKCHSEQPAQIAANGASHQTEIDCQACHEGHRPNVANNIPQCSACHEGSVHYEVGNCLSCHNPHQPLSLIHISEPTRQKLISYAVFCLKKFFFNDPATTEIYT